MLSLSAYVRPEALDDVCDRLTASPGVRHVMRGNPTTDGLVHLTAHVDPGSADLVIELLTNDEVRAEEVSFVRPSVLLSHLMGLPGAGGDPEQEVWAEVVGRAWRNSRLRTVDLVFMVAAGVIGGVGVLTGSAILVVGAMALSPDLLPITATSVGLVERQWRLATRALGALLLGLATSALAACAAVLVLRLTGRVDEGLMLADTVLGSSLTTLGPGTALVAVSAGVAGLLAYERMGAGAVGVAISVTTLPAAAYVGDAIALGRSTPTGGALIVLITNVALVITAATSTLIVQRWRLRTRAATGS